VLRGRSESRRRITMSFETSVHLSCRHHRRSFGSSYRNLKLLPPLRTGNLRALRCRQSKRVRWRHAKLLAANPQKARSSRPRRAAKRS